MIDWKDLPTVCERCGEPLGPADRIHIQQGWRQPESGCLGCQSDDEQAHELYAMARSLLATAEKHDAVAAALRATDPDSPFITLHEHESRDRRVGARDLLTRVSDYHLSHIRQYAEGLAEIADLPEVERPDDEEADG